MFIVYNIQYEYVEGIKLNEKNGENNKEMRSLLREVERKGRRCYNKCREEHWSEIFDVV